MSSHDHTTAPPESTASEPALAPQATPAAANPQLEEEGAGAHASSADGPAESQAVASAHCRRGQDLADRTITGNESCSAATATKPNQAEDAAEAEAEDYAPNSDSGPCDKLAGPPEPSALGWLQRACNRMHTCMGTSSPSAMMGVATVTITAAAAAYLLVAQPRDGFGFSWRGSGAEL
jgi:hypothetical protein